MDAHILDKAISVIVGLVAIAIYFGFPVIKPLKGKKIVLILGILVIVGGVGSSVLYKIAENRTLTADQVVLAMKQKMKLPAMVDEITRLDSLEAEGEDVVIYKMSILEPDPQITEKIIPVLQKNMSESACANPNWSLMFSSGFSIKLVYSDIHKREFPPMLFRPDMCAGKN